MLLSTSSTTNRKYFIFILLLIFILQCVNLCAKSPRRSILNSSSMFPNSPIVTPLLADLVTLKKASWVPFLYLAWILGYFIHSLHICTKYFYEISPNPMRLSVSMYSSFIDFINIVLDESLFKPCHVFESLYLNISTKYWRL